MKTCFIIGCGETGKYMPVLDSVTVIGVNDAAKFGKPIDILLFINRPRHFNERSELEHLTRLEVIKSTKPKKVVTLPSLLVEWSTWFTGNIELITVTRWRKQIRPNETYHVDSSPFTAMSYAFNQGYTEIVLWGVDFINHRYLKAETSSPAFSQFAMEAGKLGCKIYKGHHNQKLNLPIWTV